MKRRTLLELAGTSLLGSFCAEGKSPETLKAAAAKSGKLLGMFSQRREISTDPFVASIIPKEFSMLADGNDLKMNRVRPTPTSYFFTDGDWAVNWAAQNNLLFRAHALIWHNALPTWFKSYVNQGNARQVLTDHVTTVMKHYAGKVYSWDVVNEPLHHDGRPDGLRVAPWLQLAGQDYIELALHTAAAADPNAKLVINENSLEYSDQGYQDRRDALVGLCRKLKSENVPLHAIGLQSHLKAGMPLATPQVTAFLKSLQDLGLEIWITELDVDDSALSNDQREKGVADTYSNYVSAVGPFVKVITFEQATDRNNWLDQDVAVKNQVGGNIQHAPNIFGKDNKPKVAYTETVKALRKLPSSQ